MHAKSYSEVTSIDQSSPPRSPRRPLYYVQSPSNHDVEKMSYASSPMASPPHHFYHASPIHHSRESSTSRFSASLKNPRPLSAWRKIQRDQESEDEDGGDDGGDGDKDEKWSRKLRLYVFLFVLFVLLFTVFSLILWGASRSYDPEIVFQNMVFERFNVQAGNDHGGVPTDLMSLNSTVKILYRNPATFFGVHVSSTPLQLQYFQLPIASGQMKEFYQSRKSERKMVTVVVGHQIPLYGGISVLGNSKDPSRDTVEVPLNLTITVRSRAYILGHLVKSTFHSSITCPVTLNNKNLGKSHVFKDSCIFN